VANAGVKLLKRFPCCTLPHVASSLDAFKVLGHDNVEFRSINRSEKWDGQKAEESNGLIIVKRGLLLSEVFFPTICGVWGDIVGNSS